DFYPDRARHGTCAHIIRRPRRQYVFTSRYIGPDHGETLQLPRRRRDNEDDLLLANQFVPGKEFHFGHITIWIACDGLYFDVGWCDEYRTIRRFSNCNARRKIEIIVADV